jgi:DNA primase
VSMIPDELVDQVRDGADLVGIIGETVELKRTGSDYRGPCPFHGGTHRNFAVIPRKGRYYCFVCHESGDVFSWFMKRVGMDYPTAVREVARRVGIVIPERAERGGAGPL